MVMETSQFLVFELIKSGTNFQQKLIEAVRSDFSLHHMSAWCLNGCDCMWLRDVCSRLGAIYASRQWKLKYKGKHKTTNTNYCTQPMPQTRSWCELRRVMKMKMEVETGKRQLINSWRRAAEKLRINLSAIRDGRYNWRRNFPLIA